MIIEAPCGKMEGREKGDTLQFLGIPYACPPVGKLRFRPTVPLPPWEGVRDCSKPGHAAPQTAVAGLAQLPKDERMDEDCLYLNVTVPKGCRRAPVLFWIHGGAFVKGSGMLGIHPESFTKEGFAVVSCNYRLGALGFLDVSGRLGDSYRQSGNSGLLDVMQALRWTQENIASFGGDPDNVSIMGQSAGAKLCGALTIAKDAKGLFRRAVLCSGAVQCIRSQHTAQRVAEKFFENAGLAEGEEEKLLTMPWQDILHAQKPFFAGLNLHAAGLVFDGETFEGDDALALLRRSGDRNIDLLLGTNRDEMELYRQIYGVEELTPELAERLFGNRAAIVQRACERIPRGDRFEENLIHVLTEYIYRAGTVGMAEAAAAAGHAVYLYRLDWDRQAFRACHASETQFLMGVGVVIRDVDHSPEHERLAGAMRGAFCSFMKTGCPEAEGLPPWPRFEEKDRQMMIFDAESRIAAAPLKETDPEMPYAVFEVD